MNLTTKFIFVLLVAYFVIFQHVFGQYSTCFYLTTEKAALEYYAKNYKASAKLYEKAFTLQPNAFPKDFIIAAKVNAALQENKKAITYLKKAISRGVNWDEIVIEDTIWNSLQKTTQWDKLKANYNSLRSKYLLNIDYDLSRKIVSMEAFDQKVRHHFNNPKLYAITDSVHLGELKSMISKDKFPSYDAFPYQDRIDLLVLLIHAVQRDSSTWAYFRPILLAQITKGNFLPKDYALIANSYYHTWKNVSYYGNINRQKKFEPPVMAASAVEKRRQEIGLMSLAGLANLTKAKGLPDGYQALKDYYIKACE